MAITKGRIALNNRFIEVFRLLEDRGDIIKNDRGGKGMGDFAEKILGNRAYGHIVRAYLDENKRRYISYDEARILCDIYKVNQSFLLEGKGKPFGIDITENTRASTNTLKGNILYTSVRAFAGSGEGAAAADYEEKDFFSIPGYTGNGYVAFPVDGNSMDPVILDGDIVVCEKITGVGELRDNEIYAVRTHTGMWIKYVQKIENSKRRVIKLKLISANYLEFDPIEVDVDEYIELYKVISRISKF